MSIRLARIPILPEILYRLCFLENRQYQFIQFARKNKIEYADATKQLPLPSLSCEVVYSSHMIEHLDRQGATQFLCEVFRVLCPGGILRLVIPDLNKQIQEYNCSKDADSFIASTHLTMSYPRSLLEKLRFLWIGPRHHLWMYDGNSLIRFLEKHGFLNAMIVPAGQTNILNPFPLDLYERASESVYVEAERPKSCVSGENDENSGNQPYVYCGY